MELNKIRGRKVYCYILTQIQLTILSQNKHNTHYLKDIYSVIVKESGI